MKKILVGLSILFALLSLMLVKTDYVQASRGGGKGKPTPTPALRLPYQCGEDACDAYRCVIGNLIRPVCYNEAEKQEAECEHGTFVKIPTFNACYETQYYLDWGI